MIECAIITFSFFFSMYVNKKKYTLQSSASFNWTLIFVSLFYKNMLIFSFFLFTQKKKATEGSGLLNEAVFF